MRLRRELHAAFDELGAPTHDLHLRMAETVVRVPARRRERAPWLEVARPPLALVAVSLLFAIVVGVLTGPRLVHDWQKYVSRNTPAGQIDTTQLRALEARPVQLPILGAGAQCQTGPWSDQGWLGAGPVYLSSLLESGQGAGVTYTNWGMYAAFDVYSDAALRGVVLVRGRNVRTGEAVVFVGAYSVGPVSGADTLRSESVAQHLELAVDAGQPAVRQPAGFGQWRMEAGVSLGARPRILSGLDANGEPLCIGWQVDGVGFTETFVTSL